MSLDVLGQRNVTLPRAASMTKMVWDDALADAASKTLRICLPLPNEDQGELIKFGQFQAVGLDPHISNLSSANLKEVLENKFYSGAQYFNLSLLTDYPRDEYYKFFTILAHHSSLYVGCAIAERPGVWDFIMIVCYFTLSEEDEHNILYKPLKPDEDSCSDCPFKFVDYFCSTNYTSLCARPEWPLADYRTHTRSWLSGFRKYKSMNIPLLFQ